MARFLSLGAIQIFQGVAHVCVKSRHKECHCKSYRHGNVHRSELRYNTFCTTRSWRHILPEPFMILGGLVHCTVSFCTIPRSHPAHTPHHEHRSRIAGLAGPTMRACGCFWRSVSHHVTHTGGVMMTPLHRGTLHCSYLLRHLAKRNCRLSWLPRGLRSSSNARW